MSVLALIVLLAFLGIQNSDQPADKLFSDVAGEYSFQRDVSCVPLAEDGGPLTSLYSIRETGRLVVGGDGKCEAFLKTVSMNRVSGEERVGTKEGRHLLVLSGDKMLTFRAGIRIEFGYFPIPLWQHELFHQPRMNSDVFVESLESNEHQIVLVWDRQGTDELQVLLSAQAEITNDSGRAMGSGCIHRVFEGGKLHESDSRWHILSKRKEVGESSILTGDDSRLVGENTRLLFRSRTRIVRISLPKP